MPSSILVGLAVFIVGAAVILHRYNARVIRRLAALLTKHRAAATTPIRHRPAEAGHPLLRRHEKHYALLTGELESLGMTILGDREELNLDGSSAGVARWFVDSARRVSGWCSVFTGPKRAIEVVMLFSELDPTAFVTTTRGGPNHPLAAPPTLDRRHLESGVALSECLRQHYSRADTHAAARMVETPDLEAAEALVDRLREHLAGWRAAQDPDTLLREDLRSTLGRRYDELGPALFKVMQAHQRDSSPPS